MYAGQVIMALLFLHRSVPFTQDPAQRLYKADLLTPVTLLPKAVVQIAALILKTGRQPTAGQAATAHHQPIAGRAAVVHHHLTAGQAAAAHHRPIVDQAVHQAHPTVQVVADQALQAHHTVPVAADQALPDHQVAQAHLHTVQAEDKLIQRSIQIAGYYSFKIHNYEKANFIGYYNCLYHNSSRSVCC
jgi:hypothetical protein